MRLFRKMCEMRETSEGQQRRGPKPKILNPKPKILNPKPTRTRSQTLNPHALPTRYATRTATALLPVDKTQIVAVNKAACYVVQIPLPTFGAKGMVQGVKRGTARLRQLPNLQT